MRRAPPDDSSLAARLDHLFQTVVRPDGRKYTYDQVARALAQQSPPVQVTGSLIWRLHRGKSRDASLSVVVALARFFDVPANYFLLDNEEIAAVLVQDRTLHASLDDESIRDIVLALRGLSASSLAAIADLVHAMRRAEKLAAVGSGGIHGLGNA
jgi:hypothetical protein